MFPTFDIPRSETVGARRDRKAKERGSRKSVSHSVSSGEVSCENESNSKRLLASRSSDSSNSSSNITAPSFKTSSAFSSFRFPKRSQSKSSINTSGPKLAPVAMERSVPTSLEPSPVESVKQDITVINSSTQTLQKQEMPVVDPPQKLDTALIQPLSQRPSRHDLYYVRPTIPQHPFPSRSLPPLPTLPESKPAILAVKPKHIADVKRLSTSRFNGRTPSVNSRSEALPRQSEIVHQDEHSDTSSPSDIVSLVLEEELQDMIRRFPISDIPHRPKHKQSHSFILNTVPHIRTDSRSSDEGNIFESFPTSSSSEEFHTWSSTTPFAEVLMKISNSGPRIISTRLAEEWHSQFANEQSFQEVAFDKRLWALTAYERLTGGKQILSPAHELLLSSRVGDNRRILNLHGSTADGWYLATRYPESTVYTLSLRSTDYAPPTYLSPTNHYFVSMPSASSIMPFPDFHFDVVAIHCPTTSLPQQDWATILLDCMRTLKPGGLVETLSIDPEMNRQGPLLTKWVHENVTKELDSNAGYSRHFENLLESMKNLGLHDVRRVRLALPTQVNGTSNSSSSRSGTVKNKIRTGIVEVADVDRMMGFLGRHLYQASYGHRMRLRTGSTWFWSEKEIRAECRSLQTKMILTILCAQKPVTKVTPSASKIDLVD